MTLKEIAEQKLIGSGVQYSFIPLPEDLPLDLPAHIAFHKITFREAVPTLIYHTEKGLIAVQRRADTKLNVKKLKELVGIKRFNMASPEDLVALDTEPGIVPLTGLDIPYYVDQRVLELDQAYGGGGSKTFALKLNPRDLININSATVGDFAEIPQAQTYETVKFEDFAKLEIKIGTVVEAERVAGSDRLLRIVMDMGTEKRQVVAGFGFKFSPEDLLGKQAPIILNIEKTVMKGIESTGVFVAIDAEEPVLLLPEKSVPNGSKIK